jgi:hypothetical protein
MPIQGLTNQWETYDALFDRFAALPDDDVPGSLVGKYRMIRELLATLHGSTESIIYVGTSHSTMNFGTRDAVSYKDRTQPFAFVDVVVANKTSGEYTFRVETREIDHDRPTSKWIVRKTTDAEAVAKMVREALLYADVPQRQNEAIG